MENPITYAKHHKYIMYGLTALVILTTAIGSRVLGPKTAGVQGNAIPKVKLVEAKDYLRDRGSISANGTVESLDQADLRSQGSGQVTAVRAKIGQKVTSGQILISLQQSDAAAGLAQARAGLKAQQARLDEMKKGARTEQVQIAENALNSAKRGLEDAKTLQDTLVKNAYSALLNAGLALTPSSYNQSSAKVTLSGSYLFDKEGIYTVKFPQGGEKPPFSVFGLEVASGWVTRGTASPIGKGGLFFTVSSDGDIYPGDSWMVTIPNTQSPAYSAAKNGYDAAVAAREAAINGATSAVDAAQKQYDLVLAGATNEQIQAQEAAVEQASASVQAMLAQLEKTVIRSPINGVVADISVKYGELVSPGALVAKVVSKGGLQVRIFISESDQSYVKEGADAVINENIKGKISHLSPSLDPGTKNIEALVAVSDDKPDLVVGQNANVTIKAGETNGPAIFLLPIQAVQIENNGASIFTVNVSSTLNKVPVKLGKVDGEMVEVTDGIKPEMKIVPTVYDLKEGEQVIVE